MQQEELTMTRLVIVLIISMFLFSLGLLLLFMKYQVRKNALIIQNRDMEKKFQDVLMQSRIETQEETLSVLSKELHDNIGQLLNSTKLLIGVSQRQTGAPSDTLMIADETLGKAIQELRALSKSLDKEWLEQFNFIDNLGAEIKRLNNADHMRFHFSYTSQLSLPAEEQIILFRIVQEAMQNAVKHAEATQVRIEVHEHDGVLGITVSDNGNGFTLLDAVQKGIGMMNMKHRTQLLGGTIQWQQTVEKGTAVTIQLPVKTTMI